MSDGCPSWASAGIATAGAAAPALRASPSLPAAVPAPNPGAGPAELAPRGRLHFVLNGGAGNQHDDALQQTLHQVLGAAGRPFTVHRVVRPQALQATAEAAVAEAASAAEPGMVVSVGGDGTLNTVASAVLGRPVALGLVPRGTFNYVARAHGIPLDTAEALQLLLSGRARALQVGLLNGLPFLVNASLGLYPELLEDREAFKQRYGRTRLVAMLAALATVMRVHPRLSLRVQADGAAPRTVRVSTLFVGNNALQLQTLGLPEAEVAGRSALAVLALRAFRPGELLWLALRGAFGRLGEADDLVHFSCQELRAQPALPLLQRHWKVALDGEVTRLRPPLQFTVDERVLWLVRPAAGAAESG